MVGTGLLQMALAANDYIKSTIISPLIRVFLDLLTSIVLYICIPLVLLAQVSWRLQASQLCGIYGSNPVSN